MEKFTKSFAIAVFLGDKSDDLWFLKNNQDGLDLTLDVYRAFNFISQENAEQHLEANCKNLPFDCFTIMPIYIK